MPDQWDAAIVGAGPAGATLAAHLAGRGWRVVLLDAARFPRQKVCGEYLSGAVWPVLDELGVADAVREGAVPLASLRLVLPGGHAIDAPFAAPVEQRPASLSRYRFDDLLVRHAVACGALLREGYRVTGVGCEGGRAVTLHAASVDHALAPLDIRADWIIAADGRRSIVVRDTGTLARRRHGLVGFKRHFLGEPPESLVGALEMHSFPGGYIGVGPVEGGAWNVCGVMPRRWVRAARGSIDEACRQWIGERAPLAAFLRRAQPIGDWLTVPEVATQLALPRVTGVLYVGDACGTIEPLAGQGMTMALASAALAAEILASGQADACRQYSSAWQQRFGRHVRRAHWVAGLLRRPRLLAALLPLDWLAHRLASALLARGYRAIALDAAATHEPAPAQPNSL